MWKLTQAAVYERFGRVKEAFKIRDTLIDKALKAKFISAHFLLDLLQQADISKREKLLKTLKVKDFDNYYEVKKYYMAQVGLFISANRFDEAEKVFIEWKDYMDQRYGLMPPIELYNFSILNLSFCTRKANTLVL